MRGYAAQDDVFSRKRRPLTMAEARDLADKLCAHFGIEPIAVRRTQGGGYSSTYHSARGVLQLQPASIRLSERAPDWIVCHEVAHYAAHVLANDHGHGELWAGAYIEAVRVGITEHQAHRLDLAMHRHGLRPAWPPL